MNTPYRIIPIIKAESLIPFGGYCYKGLQKKEDEPLEFKVVDKCPFHSINEDHIENGSIQMAGYCSYLKLGDWMDNGTFLLFDMVKECGVKEEDEFVLSS